MPQVGKSNLSLMNAILNTALDAVLVSMAQNSALQSELSYIFGKPFFPPTLKPKEEKDVPELLQTGKPAWFNLIGSC